MSVAAAVVDVGGGGDVVRRRHKEMKEGTLYRDAAPPRRS